ncbi:hypothetical protein PABG_00520 [Paracoccidioides brasiliensis Pb03]|uniref:Aminoglycoside phosphotransferase domain-containing protein n=2 Tax=Paracoccidioides brasiliensis TaxID=121759 RepID=C1G6Y1_PARBD|nr:uncharacterized protein PADG_02936 [Paracoccidioides brasiliensis Pb18]EEH17957.2 hypothetical protein PABG_00520 [Paracoccidioides brasiliensis Pb03]EEH46838.2 hypothetical protein PADG_02936 [Paracoccidioides brasiliensis Pb18]ODH13225.1 hypothetical protein ACO22_07475 [Paracoccidioides brasiliensis]ODH48816.1 hypothetical protein GX48_05040 [Paracoccidioides brasiliensis]
MSFEFDDGGEVIHSLGNRTVIRYGEDKVVKSGSININEADTLRFVAENTTIPVPRVHAVRQDGYRKAIVMDYMPGTPLEEAWETLTHDQRISATRQIGSYISQLRRLKGSFIGGLNRCQATVGRYDRVSCGPFDNEKDFNEFLLSRIIKQAPSTLRHYAKACLKENHDIIFSHGDLAPRNILVDQHGNITAIIDWEDAGWYPEYWEHYRALRQLNPMPGWPDYFNYMLPPCYEEEYVGISFLSSISAF